MTRLLLILLLVSAPVSAQDFTVLAPDSMPLWIYNPDWTGKPDSLYSLLPVYLHDISYDQARLVPFWHDVVWIFVGTPPDSFRYNPAWRGMKPELLVVTAGGWVVSYPSRWPICDNGVSWVWADTDIDGDLDGLPDYFAFDGNCDGHINLSDLTFFGADYGTGKRWGLSNFTALGTLYNYRRQYAPE